MNESNDANAQSIKEIFFAALEQPNAEARAAFLAGACGQNPVLRQKIDKLLADHFEEDSFLKTAAVDCALTVMESTPVTEGPGAQIDRYKLLQKLGEGGFGVVYMAEQKEPVKRRIALKIIKLGMDTKQVVARFEAERQALAMMDHPNIAKVLDAGATETGRPYFVMELVKGVPITKYSDDNNLTTKERLDLFIPVCKAIQHAHQKGIIHRDIKPSNVMITLHDGQPIPKVIDFGIAKATQQELTEKTIFTQYSQFIGTPAYMSPEQAEMSGLDVDTRSDIYSLGVLLYELLVGRTPLNAKELMSGGYDEIRRRIKEEEAPKPSTWVNTMEGSEKTTVAKHRKIGPDQLSSELRGDLDWIVLKALEKDRTRRYETANGFALDIQRYLKDEPVAAVAPSKGYLLKKYVQRHKTSLAVAATIAGLLIAGVATSTILAINFRHAQLAAEEAHIKESEQKLLAQEKQKEAELAENRADLALAEVEQSRNKLRVQVYQADMNLAAQAYHEGNIGRMNELLEKHWLDPWEDSDLRGFEWYHWWEAGHPQVTPLVSDLRPLRRLAISGDGGMVAVGGWPGKVVVGSFHDATFRKEIPTGGEWASVAFSPDGAFMVIGETGPAIQLCETATWETKTLTAPGRGGNEVSAFSPTQPLMATGGWSAQVVLWDTKEWKPLGPPLQTGDWVLGLTFTRDGRHLIAAVRDSTIVVWDISENQKPVLKKTLARHHKPVSSVASASNADLFASGSADGTVCLWNSDFELIETYDVSGPVSVVAFSPDGGQLLAGTHENNRVVVWDVRRQPGQPASLEPAHEMTGHSRKIFGAVFVPGTGNIVSLSEDGSAKMWDLDHCEPWEDLGPLEKTPVEVGRLTYAEDGSGLWITDSDGKQYWSRLNSGELVEPPKTHNLQTLTVTPDKAWQAVVTGDGHVGVWDVRRGELLGRHSALASTANSMILSSSGPTVAWRTETNVWVWNVRNNNSHALGTSVVHPPTLSPDARQLAIYDSYGFETVVWDLTFDPPRVAWKANGFGPDRCGAFSHDGALLAIGGWSNDIRLHNAETGELLATLKGHTDDVRCLDFSRNGGRLVSGSKDHTLRIWDVETRSLLSSLDTPNGWAVSVAFSSGEDSIASLGYDDGIVRLWKTASHETVNAHVDHWIARARNYSRQQRWDQAFAILDEGLRHNPDSEHLFIRTRGELNQQKGDWDAAFLDLTKAIALAPSDTQLIRSLGKLYAGRHRWSEAAAQFHRLIELVPTDEQDWMKTAALLIAAGDQSGYHQLCEDLLQEFQQPGEQEVFERIAKACLFAPPTQKGLTASVPFARNSVANTHHWVMPYALMTRGLADYRSGEYEAARDWLHRALGQPPTWFVEAEANLVLAMSEKQLGQSEAARDALEKAQIILEDQATDYTGRLGEDWHDWLICQALLKEAESLIHGAQAEKTGR